MMHVRQPIQIAGIPFANAVMNGAYIGSKTYRDIQALCVSHSGAVVVGSISVEARKRNAGHGYWRHPNDIYALNSYGMPNGGLPYFAKQLPRMVELAHAHGKPLIANVVGFSIDEFAELVTFAHGAGADIIELNLGCPNVWKDGVQKRIVSYHPELVRLTLDAIKQQAPSAVICVKISPLPPDLLRDVAQVISESGIVRAVTATNSYPNAAVSSDTRITNEDVLAGLTGRALKPISLGAVRQLRALLPASVDIIGCGGVYTARDVADYLEAGAKAVQVASGLVAHGPALFTKLLH